jgi:hypothetical protein
LFNFYVEPNILRATAAGLCFATWPLLVKAGGMSGFTSACFISIMCVLGAVPFTLAETGLMGVARGSVVTVVVTAVLVAAALMLMRFNGTSLAAVLGNIGLGKVLWPYALAAGAVGAAGMLFFNAMLAASSSTSVGVYCLTTIVVQVTSVALYTLVREGSFSTVKVTGIVVTISGIILVNQK